MANLKVELVKSLNGRHEKHIATANSMGLRKIGDTSVQPTTTRRVARSPRSAICCRSLKRTKEVRENETERNCLPQPAPLGAYRKVAAAAPVTARPQVAATRSEGPFRRRHPHRL